MGIKLPKLLGNVTPRKLPAAGPLASAEDVPTISPRVTADPGVKAPVQAFESPIGVAAEEISGPLQKAAERMQSREDAISTAGGVTDYNQQAKDTVRSFTTEKDLSKPEDSAALGLELENLKSQALANFTGSPDARAKLEARLIGIQSGYEGQAGEISAAISLDRMNETIDLGVTQAVNQAGQAASTWTVGDRGISGLQEDIALALQASDDHVDLVAGGLTILQERSMKKAGRARVAESTLNTLIRRNQADVAEQLLSTGIGASLTPAQRQRVVQKIADVTVARTSMLRKVQQAELVVGPLNAQQRARLVGLGTRLLSPEEFDQKVALWKATSGKGVPSPPTKGDLERTSLLLEEKNLGEIVNFDSLTFAVASRGREIMKEKKIGSFEATNEAIIELEEKIKRDVKQPGWFGWDWLSTTADVFDPEGNIEEPVKAPAKARSLPSTKDLLVIGEEYETSRGPAIWTGTGFQQ